MAPLIANCEIGIELMLQIEGIVKNFGGLQALADVTVSFGRGEFVGLIGPNGSGKTTLLNCITGIYRPDAGTIRFGNAEMSGLRPHKIFQLGIGRTFQISKVFNRLSVRQNLSIPALTERRLDREAIDARTRKGGNIDIVLLGDLANDGRALLATPTGNVVVSDGGGGG